jgi:hypothetical protein
VRCGFNDNDFSPLELGLEFCGTDRTVVQNGMLAGVPIVNT